MAIPMEDITADHQFLRDRIVESEVQGPLKILQLITATMLLGSLSLGLVMSFLFLRGIETSHKAGALFIGSRCCLSLYCEPDFHKIRVAGRENHHLDGFLGAL